MTLTEIEDSVVENFLRGTVGKERVLGINISAYLSFLQATEIRRRLVDEAEKKASLKSYEISFAAPVTVPESTTVTWK